jgi:hypothetical protein
MGAKTESMQVAQLVNMGSPDAVFEEVKYNFIQQYPVAAFIDVRIAYNDFCDLFEGRYAGYRACNTKFHDKIHTTDALLAISRLIDGYNLVKPHLPVHMVKLALIATILHDTGYIQSRQDRKGTGAKYTLNHVERSIDFMRKYFKERGFGRKDFEAAARMISCTGLSTDLAHVRFRGPGERILGYMLGTADLLGQMASRTYLERLIYLYREFREGHVKGYDSEFSLLRKTLDFYDSTKTRLARELKNVARYTRFHFRRRYRIDADLYTVAIERQIAYLTEILRFETPSYRDKLKRRL